MPMPLFNDIVQSILDSYKIRWNKAAFIYEFLCKKFVEKQANAGDWLVALRSTMLLKSN